MWFCRVKPLRHLNVLKESSKSPWLFSLSGTLFCTSSKKSKLAPLQERRMIDRFKLCAKGGDGGSGCVSVRRSRHDRRGRPDGGNGGKGGDVILECSRTHWDFSSLQHHVAADKGGNGASKNKIGTRGADKVVQVPIGTVIHLVKGEVPSSIARDQSSTELDPWEIPGYLLDKGQRSSPDDTSSAEKAEPAINAGCSSSHHRDKSNFRKTTNEVSLSSPFSAEEETEEMLYNVAELTEEGQRMIIARGGEGGQGNVYASHISKKPKTSKLSVQNNVGVDPDESMDESSLRAGLTGSESYLVLELKSIADVGLVGMPNAGKSTLLGAISRAKPAVGHYAFTTLRPNLGKLNFDDFSFTVADIPGLIKGAHENRGLGHAFLRHIERTRVLAYVVDLSATLDGRKGIPPWEQLRDLVFELERHQEGLSDRPSLVVANKIDEEGAELVYQELKARVDNVPIYPISAILEEGIPELKAGLKSLVNGDVCDRLYADRIVFD